MATERIELEFGGKYSIGQQFAQFGKDVKTAGKDLKDMGGAAKSVATEIASAFGGKLNTTVSTSLSLFQEMARGGIWGAVTVAVNSAVSFIATKWTEAKEAAQKYADLCRTEIINGMKAVVDGFGGVSKAIAETNAEAKELIAVTNGEVATRAELKVHEINVKALQSITDDMTAATRAAVMAQAQLEQAEVRASAATEQAANARQAAQAAETQIRQKREAAETALGEAQAKRAEFEEKARRLGTGWMARYEELQQKAGMSVQELMAMGLALEQALAWRKSASLALAKFEEEHKSEVEQLNSVTKLEETAKENVEAAKREEAAAARAVTLATQKEEVAHAAATDSVAQAKQRYYDANKALDEETKSRQVAAQAAERSAEIAAVVDKIKCDAIEKDIDYTEWVELATKALEEGYSAETAINLVRLRYKAALEKTAKQQEAAAAGQNGKGGTAVQAIAEGVRKGMEGMSVNTNVNTAGVGDGVDQSDEVITLGGLQRDVRDEQRKARNHLDSVKQSSNAMKAYISGKMSPDVAAAFEKKMKANGWTSRDIQTATEKALKSQLLTHSQVVEQQKAILDIKKKLEDMGLK